MNKEFNKKLNLIDEKRNRVISEIKLNFSAPLFNVYVREVGYPIFVGYKEIEPNYWYELMSIYELQKLFKELNKPFWRPINPSDLRDRNDIPFEERESGMIVGIDIFPKFDAFVKQNYKQWERWKELSNFIHQ